MVASFYDRVWKQRGKEKGGGGGWRGREESGNGQRLQAPLTLFPSACFSTPFPLPPFFAPTRQATAGEEEFFLTIKTLFIC